MNWLKIQLAVRIGPYQGIGETDETTFDGGHDHRGDDYWNSFG